ncbi:cytochrome b561 [Planctomycetales bacterium]|nr:cytochrome b561 [Planctomycetales bacterium]
MFRRLYNWVLSWAETKYGSPALFVMAFAESSFFPIPPDVLQIALSAGKPLRSFLYATICLVGSILGAVLGYYIGLALWETVKDFFFTYIPGFTPTVFEYVQKQYSDHAFWAVFSAAFTPIPYKVFTIAAGVCKISIFTFIAASIVGRGLRFFLVAGLMYTFGPTVKNWIDRYFNLLTIAFTILLVGGFFALKFLL